MEAKKTVEVFSYDVRKKIKTFCFPPKIHFSLLIKKSNLKHLGLQKCCGPWALDLLCLRTVHNGEMQQFSGQ